MSRVTGQVQIEAPAERVWAVLADFGAIAQWSPTVERSYLTTEAGQEVGTGRHLDLAGGWHVDRAIEDRVLEWDEGRRYLVESSGMRVMKYVRNEWAIEAASVGAVVTLTFDFAAKLGLLGTLAERLLMRRQVRKAVVLILAGLKRHVETGERIGTMPPPNATVDVTTT